MNNTPFSSFFAPDESQNNNANSGQGQIAPDSNPGQLQIGPEKTIIPQPASGPIWTCLDLSDAIWSKLHFPGSGVWMLPTQAAWVRDPWPLRIWEKSRQVGATKIDALDSVLKVSPAEARFDVWVTSRDDGPTFIYPGGLRLLSLKFSNLKSHSHELPHASCFTHHSPV